MIKQVLCLLLLSLFSLSAEVKISQFKQIKQLQMQQKIPVSVALELLANLAELNIKVSEAASANQIHISLSQINALQMLEEICKSAKIAYSYDRKSKIFTVMTREEYLAHLPLNMNQQFKTFRVSPENLEMIPEILSQSFPGQVFSSDSLEVKRFPVTEGQNQAKTSRSSLGAAGRIGQINEATFLAGIQLPIDKILEIERKKIFHTDGDYKVDYSELIKNSRLNLPPVIISKNTEHSFLVVRTFGESSMKFVEDFIKEHNKTAPQVLLEMKILELQVGDDFQSSFDYTIKNVSGNSPGVDSDITLGDPTNIIPDASVSYEFISDKIDAKIQLLKKNNQLEVLATPIILAANNRAAEFQVTDEDLLLTGFTTGTRNVTDGSGAIRQESFSIPEYDEEDIGLTLKILPTIIDEKKIILAVEQESSDKLENGSSIEFLVGDQLETRLVDIKSERSIKSTVIAHDGKSIAIGGLVRTQNKIELDKVPILGDIPLIGFFFRSEVTKNVKTELVLLITPHIIKSEDDLVKSKQLIKKISNHNFHDGGQKAVDAKVKDLEDYNKPRNNKIRDFVKDPESTLNTK